MDNTVEIQKRYRIPTNDFADYVEEFLEDTEMDLVNNGVPFDHCYLAYDQVLQLARLYIEKYTGLDIMNYFYCTVCWEFISFDD